MIKHLLSAIVYAIAYALPAHADNGYDLTSLTNLFIGTGALGHTLPNDKPIPPQWSRTE